MSSPVTMNCLHLTFFPSQHRCLVFVLSASSVSRTVGCVRASVLSGVSACCVCCGGSADGLDVSWCRVCAENACGGMANSVSDHIERNSWKHEPEVPGRTKALIQCSGTTDRRSFVGTVVGGAALAQYLRGAPEGIKVGRGVGKPHFHLFQTCKLGCFGR